MSVAALGRLMYWVGWQSRVEFNLIWWFHDFLSSILGLGRRAVSLEFKDALLDSWLLEFMLRLGRNGILTWNSWDALDGSWRLVFMRRLGRRGS